MPFKGINMSPEGRKFFEANGYAPSEIGMMLGIVDSDQNSSETSKGTKFDSGKLRWDLVPFDCLEEVVDIYGRGAEVHGDNNWKKVNRGSERYFAALMRHLVAYRRGEEFDAPWHTRHLAHVVWNALALLWFQTHPQNEEKK